MKKTVAEKSVLNNWFKTGAKPTQERFWAWQDSYWHKNETIPIAKIEDISTILSNKAEVSALEGKADKSAVYTIRQVDAKLEGKLNVPEDAFATPSHLIAMGARQERGEEGDVVIKLPISSIQGQNISSHYLTSVAGAGLRLGANWEIDTAGYYFKIKGLQDKSNDPTYGKKLIVDENGNISTGNKTDITNNVTVNIPSTINVLYNSTIQNANYVPNPSTPDDIKVTFEVIKDLEDGIQFTPFLASEIEFTQLPQDKFPHVLKDRGYQFSDEFRIEDGKISRLKHAEYPWDFSNAVWLSENEHNDLLHQFLFNRQMPSDRNWVIKFRNTHQRVFGYDASFTMGIVPSTSHFDYVPSRDFTFNGSGGWLMVMGQRLAYFGGEVSGVNIYLIKMGSKLSVLVHNTNNGHMGLGTVDYDENYHKYFRIGMIAMIGSHGVSQAISQIKDISYWIAP